MQDVLDGRFSEQELAEAKLSAFQKLDRVLAPQVKGLLHFTRGVEDAERLALRARALDVTREDVMRIAERYMMTNMEEQTTSRVVFGSQQAKFDALEREGWQIFNPIDFLSYQYFDQWGEQPKQV